MKCKMYVEKYLKAQEGKSVRALSLDKRAARAMAKRPGTVERCGGQLRAEVLAWEQRSGSSADVEAEFRCSRCGTLARSDTVPTTCDDINQALTLFVARIRQWKGEDNGDA